MTATPPPRTPAQAGAHPSPSPAASGGVTTPSPSLDPRQMGPGLRRGRKGRGFASLAYGLALFVILLDQGSKTWVLNGLRLPEGASIPVIPPIFNLTLSWNNGFSFGFLRHQGDLARWGLVAFSAVVVIALAVWAWRVERRLTAAAVGLIMGGAVGNNLIDRVRFGAVVDFLDVSGLHFPWIFNVADSAISIGVALLLLESFLQPKPAAAN